MLYGLTLRVFCKWSHEYWWTYCCCHYRLLPWCFCTRWLPHRSYTPWVSHAFCLAAFLVLHLQKLLFPPKKTDVTFSAPFTNLLEPSTWGKSRINWRASLLLENEIRHMILLDKNSVLRVWGTGNLLPIDSAVFNLNTNFVISSTLMKNQLDILCLL